MTKPAISESKLPNFVRLSIEGYSNTEIAKHYGISKSTVGKTLSSKPAQKLRKKFLRIITKNAIKMLKSNTAEIHISIKQNVDWLRNPTQECKDAIQKDTEK